MGNKCQNWVARLFRESVKESDSLIQGDAVFVGRMVQAELKHTRRIRQCIAQSHLSLTWGGRWLLWRWVRTCCPHPFCSGSLHPVNHTRRYHIKCSVNGLRLYPSPMSLPCLSLSELISSSLSLSTPLPSPLTLIMWSLPLLSLIYSFSLSVFPVLCIVLPPSHVINPFHSFLPLPLPMISFLLFIYLSFIYSLTSFHFLSFFDFPPYWVSLLPLYSSSLVSTLSLFFIFLYTFPSFILAVFPPYSSPCRASIRFLSSHFLHATISW